MSRDSVKEFYLGSAVEITALLSVATATTATITILDPAMTKVINAVNMTKSADKVYVYVYQSTSTDLDGTYIARLNITSGNYTTVSEDRFKFIKQSS